MIFTEKVERSYRFRLALRMGLPIFFLTIITFFAVLNQDEGMFASFVIVSLLLLGVIVYFIFYLIYQSSRERITDITTHTFTPDYFFSLYERQKGIKTLMMISLENLWAINERYGIQNGDRILSRTVLKINRFFREKGFEKLPVCRYKGGDFLLFFPGNKENYFALIELFMAKYENYLENEMEVSLEAVMVDSRLSDDVGMLLSRLYELHYDRVHGEKEDLYSITELEKEVMDALEEDRFSIGFWPVYSEESPMYDTFVKLIDSEGRFIHQNRYVPVLNRLNKMRQLESTVLEKIGSICDEREQTFVIEISSVTLRNPNFFDHAVTLFERYPFARNKITLLFKEKEYCHHLERFKQQLAHYRRIGYKIGLDKLGGYQTTLLYLKELDIDLVRFDPLYTRHINEAGYQNILQGLNLSAHLCGAKTWLPMIEDVYADNLAQSLKINYRQGNYLGKILTLDDLQGKQ